MSLNKPERVQMSQNKPKQVLSSPNDPEWSKKTQNLFKWPWITQNNSEWPWMNLSTSKWSWMTPNGPKIQESLEYPSKYLGWSLNSNAETIFSKSIWIFYFYLSKCFWNQKSAELLHEQSSMEKMHAQLHFLIRIFLLSTFFCFWEGQAQPRPEIDFLRRAYKIVTFK